MSIDFDFAPGENSGNGKPFGRSFERSSAPPPAGARPRADGEEPAYLKSLNDRQREAVEITDGPLIVLAGAGSGKTKMLTSRIAYLMDARGVPAHNILAVTFTNKAAAEMRERVEKHLAHSGVLGVPEIGTFHAVCMRLLRREAARTPYTKPFVIYDDSDQLALVKGAVQKIGIDEKAFSPKAMQAAINRAKCDAQEPQDVQPAPHDIFSRQFKRVYEQYQKDLFANNAIDFGEIICMAYRVLRDHPEARAKYQRWWRYIHVDEYQDTNRAQYLLLTQLAGASTGGHQNICVVGDEDQSIYKWRGADIRNILDFEQDYPGARVVKLEQNYRSTKTIITAAGQVIRNNRERKDKTLWTENEQGSPIVRTQLPDERAEAELVVSEIKRLAEHENRVYGDFAIFYRTHAQSRSFEDVFRREKIPYQIVGGLRFYDRKEIKDVLSYSKVILNPSDSISLKRIVNVPARGIGKTTLDKVEQLQTEAEQQGLTDMSFWGALLRASKEPQLTSPATAKKLGVFAALLEKLTEKQPQLTLSELYHLILDETGYVRELRAEGTEESLARIENLEEFDSLLQQFEEDFFERLPGGGTEEERKAKKGELLLQFLEESSLASVADDAAGSPVSAVQVMTLHSSKGLEYPVVFLVGMEEGLFPSTRPWEETSDEDIEEERRLCYVGMTRAREQLYLCHVVVRSIWGNVSYQEPARFFAEMPDELIEFKDLSYGQAAGKFRAGSSRQLGWGRAGGTGKSWGSSSSSDDFSQVNDRDDDIVGQKLQHPEYGAGTVIASEGSGHDQKVMVEFRGRDRRKFVLRYIKPFFER